MAEPDHSSSALTFSIVVPTYRRRRQLERCLHAVAALDYPRSQFEVIVVNDGAAAATEECVARARVDGLQLRSIAQRQRGPAAARNAGAALARGRLLAFTDDDCLPAADWLTRLERHLNANASAIVGGHTRNALAGVPCAAASQALIDFLYDYYQHSTAGARFFTTNNLAVHAREFHSAGGFDETFPLAASEDREFCERWQRRGGTLVYAADALVDHAHPLPFGRYLRQHFTYGRGADFLRRSRPNGVRRHSEPPWFYWKLVTYPFGRVPLLRAISLFVLLTLAQLAYVSGYLFQRLFRTTTPQRRRDDEDDVAVSR
jgi:glycosyltransferase involved in cell wall biosynthesis